MPRPDASQAPQVRRRSYAHPPIRERIAEVHVIPGPTSLATAREALAGRWPEFVRVERQAVGAVEFTWSPAENTVQTKQQSDDRFRFSRDDRKRLFQVGRELFVANDLLPEPGWEELRPMFERGYEDFLAVLQPRSVVKGVLRYLNRVNLPAGATAQDLFTIFPTLPDDRQRTQAPFQMLVDMGDRGPGPSLLVLAFAGSEAEPVYALDLVVESGRRALDSPSAVFSWAEEAHNRIAELFESSITPRARQLFGERT